MQPYTILTVPDSRLRRKATPIEKVDDVIRGIFDRMILTMNQDNGIGLAATQIAIDKRLIVMDVHDHDGESCDGCHIYRFANPKIIWTSEETEDSQEGCLSVPGQYATVTRFKSVKVRYLDENNKEQILEAQGLLGDCIQHEIDHLNGILFVDYLSAMKRKLIIQKSKKYKAQNKETHNHSG